MANISVQAGARLAFVAVPLKGDVMREKVTMVPREVGKDKHGNPRVMHEMKRVMKKEPAGFMVYFPRGHAIRVRSMEDLKKYGLDQKPNIINLEGLHDSNSPLGRLMTEQDQAARHGAFVDMQRQVIGLATKKSGSVLLPEQTEQGAKNVS